MIDEQASRRYFAASKLVAAELYRVASRALVRTTLIAVPIAFAAAVVAGYIGLTEAIGPREPIITIALVGGGLLVYGAIFGFLLWRYLGGALGNALDVIAWGAREMQQQWAAASPGTRVPRSPKEARGWLATHAETDVNLSQRVAASLMVGDLAGAQDALTRYPARTAFERHERAADGLALDLVAGRPISPEDLDAAYREIWADKPVHAVTCRSMTEVLAAAVSGGDWRPPLVRARQGLPPDAADVGRRQAWLVLFVMHVVIVAVVVGVGLGVWMLVAS